jgi:hypothetical protein
MAGRVLLAWLIIQARLVIAQQITGTVSIASDNGINHLRGCMIGVFADYGINLMATLQCPSPHYNSCYCRSDLGYLATSCISSINYKYCSYGDIDYTSELNFYNSYCAQAMDAKAGAVTSTFTSGSTPTVIVYTTVPAETANPANSAAASQFPSLPIMTTMLTMVLISVAC